YGFLDIRLVEKIFRVMCCGGKIVFENLGVIFGIGVGIGLGGSEKGRGGLGGVIGFLIMNGSMNGMVEIRDDLGKRRELGEKGESMVLGMERIERGVFGGMVRGILRGYLHNKF
ncbi:PTS transporter subunit EIIC, partial [Staphylococcus haemolyticus]|uniref:PTS transporter subunit EIIC n=1 Tax=Staphylococcus haemolyticus TaxID=1283 RepID=UPI001642F8C2